VSPLLDAAALRFGEPSYLPLLAVPVVLLLLWMFRALGWWRDARHLTRRVVPVRERFTLLGSWPFWLALVGALSLLIVAAARPQTTTTRIRTASVDLVVLQDGSASMHVADVAPDRWRRSIAFLRTLAESLNWQGDRLALALFARIAAPQVRLTRDPNVFFFFLDHIDEASPFSLADDTTWDTNIEQGLYWGTRLLERDIALNGPSGNIAAFVLVSDGQAWSGQVDVALGAAKARNIPVYVVGVGTERGGYIPEAANGAPSTDNPTPVHSVLDRRSLIAVATAGSGRYFDLGAMSDRDTANAIVAAVRRRAADRSVKEGVLDLYWYCLAGSAALAAAAVVFLGQRCEVWWMLAGLAAALVAVTAGG
jgi:Ca-activated chloride channel family protein